MARARLSLPRPKTPHILNAMYSLPLPSLRLPPPQVATDRVPTNRASRLTRWAGPLAMAALLVTGCGDSDEPKGNPIAPGSVADIQRGQSVYQTNCVACHAADGKGNPKAAGLHHPPPHINSAGLGAKQDQQIFQAISNGFSNHMPAYANVLTELEIWQVITFLRQL